MIYTEATKAALERTKQAEKETGKHRVLWRISSTLFSHLRYDVDLSPLPELAHLYNKEEATRKYRPMTSYEKLCEELLAINLAPKQSYAERAMKHEENLEEQSQEKTSL